MVTRQNHDLKYFYFHAYKTYKTLIKNSVRRGGGFDIDLVVSIRVYRFMGIDFEIYLILSHFRILVPTI
jgi:hypothetical protein